jgi:hypothetical protein
MDTDNDLTGEMTNLVDAVRKLADQPAQGPALIARNPEGLYLVSPDGSGGGPHNKYVISRSQLGTLMWENGILRDNLTDPEQAAKIATLVAAYHPPGR